MPDFIYTLAPEATQRDMDEWQEMVRELQERTAKEQRKGCDTCEWFNKSEITAAPWACFKTEMMDENMHLLTFQDGEDLITGCEYWEKRKK